MKYHYTISGRAANGAPWQTEGTLECEWHETFTLANTASFDQLTQGNARYGHPGQGSCRGPYKIEKAVIELAP
jgi:hypothetical protein